MNSIKIDNKGVLMIAHRGASSIERENTNPAFVVAGAKSYYGIETDVHVTKDGKFIICHDDDIVRVTGVNMIIEQSNYDDLKKINILDFDGSTRSDLVFPSLEDYIRICSRYDKQAILEIKNNMDVTKIIELVNIVKELDWYHKTTFISFDKDNLINLRNNFNDADIQFLTGDATTETLDFLLRYNIDLDIHFDSLTKEYIDKLHSYNIKVNCWTVDIESKASELINMGVDMITSNCLE